MNELQVKKIVFMSRNGASGREGSGEGLGFLIKGAKDFSNPDIWAGYVASAPPMTTPRATPPATRTNDDDANDSRLRRTPP